MKKRGNPALGKGSLLAKRARVDLGLALLQVLALPGQSLTLEDIAARCDCTRQAVQQIEARAMRKLRTRLDVSQFGELMSALVVTERRAARPARKNWSYAR